MPSNSAMTCDAAATPPARRRRRRAPAPGRRSRRHSRRCWRCTSPSSWMTIWPACVSTYMIVALPSRSRICTVPPRLARGSSGAPRLTCSGRMPTSSAPFSALARPFRVLTVRSWPPGRSTHGVRGPRLPLASAATKFIVGEPMKEATNLFSGRLVELHRRADLRDDAAIEDDDLVGERHRLDLVVGDVDHGRRQVLVELGDLDPHLDAEHGVEVGERLVEEEDLRLAHQRPADGDALALAAGKLRRPPVEQLLELQHRARLRACASG